MNTNTQMTTLVHLSSPSPDIHFLLLVPLKNILNAFFSNIYGATRNWPTQYLSKQIEGHWSESMSTIQQRPMFENWTFSINTLDWYFGYFLGIWHTSRRVPEKYRKKSPLRNFLPGQYEFASPGFVSEEFDKVSEWNCYQ